MQQTRINNTHQLLQGPLEYYGGFCGSLWATAPRPLIPASQRRRELTLKAV